MVSKKIELQISAMNKTGCRMSSTDGLIGNGPYDNSKNYRKYNAGYYYNALRGIYKSKGSRLLRGFQTFGG